MSTRHKGAFRFRSCRCFSVRESRIWACESGICQRMREHSMPWTHSILALQSSSGGMTASTRWSSVNGCMVTLASWSKPGISARGPPTNHDCGTRSSRSSRSNRSNIGLRLLNTDPRIPQIPEEHRNRHKVEFRKSFSPRPTPSTLCTLVTLATQRAFYHLYSNDYDCDVCRYSKSSGSVAGKPKV